MNSVLLISNQPLDGNSGRAAKFKTRVERLPELGWEVVYFDANKSLPLNLIRAWRLATKEDVNIIQSVCSPPGHPLIGLVVSLLTGIPWLLEVRDPIVCNPAVELHSKSWYARRVAEAIYVRFADMVAQLDGVQMRPEYFAETYPSLPDSKWAKLPYTGYVKDKFQTSNPSVQEGFTITYAGSFYDGWIEPYSFLVGLRRFIDANPNANVTAKFYGDWNQGYQHFVKDLNLESCVDSSEFIKHQKIVPLLQQSDVVLYLGGSNPRNRRNIPSKIWDYIGCRTPILAIVDPSFEAAKLVAETGLGLVAPPDSPSAIKTALCRFYDDSFEYSPDDAVFERFTRDRNLRALVKIFDQISDARSD